MMTKTYSFACADFPGMEACPAHFHTESKDELYEIAKRHAMIAHGENPDDWSEEDRKLVRKLFKVDP